MKKTINQKQLENMIAECVGQVLAESSKPRQQKPARKVMNEAQLNRYIQNIINEELENEGLWDFAKGMGGFLGGKAKNAANAAGQAIGGAAQKVGNAAQGAYNSAKTAVGNAAQKAGNAVKSAAQGAQQFGQQAMQAGKNASAAADTAKLVQQIDGLYQKYGKTLTKSQMASIRSAKSALNQLAQAFGSGDVNA